ncbi:MAG TPA: NADH-quinone oxidoreductase subunit K [Methanomicrobiales archaeon]|nr:NADH-quinone oxidoreductase subunit K [Methanomicrobiales archaeon]
MNITSAILVALAASLFAVGLAGLIGRGNLIRMVIGLEFLGKGASLLLITAGYAAGDTGVSQAVVFTLIAIEAVVAAVALALVILVKRTTGSLDSAMQGISGRGAS